jgi:hypothetical protein
MLGFMLSYSSHSIHFPREPGADWFLVSQVSAQLTFNGTAGSTYYYDTSNLLVA